MTNLLSHNIGCGYRIIDNMSADGYIHGCIHLRSLSYNSTTA